MSTALQMTLTDSGRAALFNAESTGVELALTHVQLGSGYRVPDASETALLLPKQAVVFASSSRVSTSQIRVSAKFSGDVLYSVSEIGLWAGEPGADGSVLFCYWSREEEEGALLQKYPGVDFIFVHDMTIGSTLPAGALTIQADSGQSITLALISNHENAADPHPQYLLETDLDLSGYAELDKTQNWTKGQAGKPAELPAVSGEVTLDLSVANNFAGTLTGNITLLNPSAMPVGQSGVLTITNGTTPYTVAYGSYWKPVDGSSLPALTAVAAAVDDLVYYVESVTRILVGRVGGSV